MKTNVRKRPNGTGLASRLPSRRINEEFLFSEAQADAPPQRPKDTTRRILVADADGDFRLLYTDALALPGCQVDAVADGIAAWEALQAKRYDLLIVENDLPKLTGVELVTKLRSTRIAVPVVMAAERLPAHELARNASLQIAATLKKPFGLDALLGAVKNILRLDAL